jgi:dipeptidyl aminopeptidase/acylaminoacyl peptidase
LAASSTWGVVVDSADESRSEPLITDATNEVFTAGWLPGGRVHVAWKNGPNGPSILRKDEGQPLQTILTQRGSIRSVRISPDGRWLAYEASDSGPFHVYLVSSTGKGDRLQVSPRPADFPRWSHDGKQLFFRRDTAMMAVDVHATGEHIEFGAERKLFDAEMAAEYAVAPNGDFYTLQPVPGVSTQTHIQLKTRWFEDVDRLMRGAERR